jgi:hypothetical protein
MGYISNIRALVRNILPEFIYRHFTLLSGTLLFVSISLNNILILVYVPQVTANSIINSILSFGTLVTSGLSVIGAVVTIADFLQKRDLFDAGITTNNSEPDTLSSPAQGFVVTDEERMKQAMNKLQGWFRIREDSGIVLTPDSEHIGNDREGMLYVFAARVAFNADERASPKVSIEEIQNEIGFSEASAKVFLDKMYNDDKKFIDIHFDVEDWKAVRQTKNSDLTFELNIKDVDEAVEYIIGERSAPN